LAAGDNSTVMLLYTRKTVDNIGASPAYGVIVGVLPPIVYCAVLRATLPVVVTTVVEPALIVVIAFPALIGGGAAAQATSVISDATKVNENKIKYLFISLNPISCPLCFYSALAALDNSTSICE